jgi:hypothetical protein
MAKSATKVKFISPIGTAQYPHLTTPDTTGKYADGKFKTKLVVPAKEGGEEFAKFLRDTAKELTGLKSPEVSIKQDDDGNYVFSFKSKFCPAVIGPDNKPINLKKLDAEFRIGGGSRIRVGGECFPYEKGISLQMKQVQIISVVTGRQSMFDEVEGDFDPSEYAGEAAVDTDAAANELGI